MRRRRLVHLGLAAAVILVLAGGWGVVRLKRYVDEDPALCAQCHRTSPEFALWTKGSHKSVACQRCHHSTPEQGLAMLRAFLAGKSPDAKASVGGKRHALVEVGACAACHLSHDPHWPQIEGSRGHRVHVEQQKIACLACHANAMHGFEPVVASCQACHGDHAVRATGMEKLHCFACHNFLSRDAGLLPTRRDCLRCHRAQGVLPARFPENAPMQFDCRTCHKPHARSAAETTVACESCHPEVARSAAHRDARGRACTACHVPHAWRVDAERPIPPRAR